MKTRYTLESAVARYCIKVQADASVPIRPLIVTPAQRVSRSCAETDVLQLSAAAGQLCNIAFDARDGGPCPCIRRGETVGTSTPGATVQRRRLQSPVTQVKRRKRRIVFRQAGADHATVSPRWHVSDRCRPHEVQGFKDAIAQRSSPGLASNRATAPGSGANRYIRHHPPTNPAPAQRAMSEVGRMFCSCRQLPVTRVKRRKRRKRLSAIRH